MSAAAAGAWTWALEIAWQASVLAALVAAADVALARRGSPHLRHALWLLVLAKFALPPSLSAPTGVVSLLREPPAGAPAAQASMVPIVCLGVWALGAAWFGGTAALRTTLVRARLRETALAVPPAIRQALTRAARTVGAARLPEVIVSPAAAGIALVGVLRPILVVPARPFAPQDAEHAFAHELVHLRRRDLWIEAAATVLRCVFWWHPAVWIAARRVADLREVCCDLDVAAALGSRAASYRETLVRAVRHLVEPRQRWGVGWVSGASALVARLDALAQPAPPRSAARRVVTTLAVAAAAACAVPMGAQLRPDAETLAAARSIFDDHYSGRDRPGCLRLHWAAAALAAAESGR